MKDSRNAGSTTLPRGLFPETYLPSGRLAAMALGLVCLAGGANFMGVSPTESAVIERTNAARARHGLPPLQIDSSLMSGSRNHAHWMAGNRNLSHGRGVAENIAMGQTSAAEAVASWMNSSGHRANILGGGYTRIGVAVAYSSDGTPYWCQQFR